MCSEVDVISVHQEHKLESRFHKDSKRCIYQNGKEHRLRHIIEFPQFNEETQITWATAPNHEHALRLWQCEVKRCAELICKLAGVSMCSMTVAQLMFSSVSNQESHSSLQGGHLPFFCFGLSENKLLPAPSSSSSGKERSTWHWSLKGCQPLCW